MKIGDCIEVIRWGECYTTYDEMAKLLGATSCWNRGVSLREGMKGYILNLRSNMVFLYEGMYDIALVEIDGYEYMVGLKGIEVISPIDFSEIDKEWEGLLSDI